MMKRIRSDISPLLVIWLTVLWLVLNETLAPKELVLGVLLATLLAWISSWLRPLRVHARRADAAALLVLMVVWEIIRSNISVARIVLGLAGSRPIHTGFLRIPLELRNPHGLAVLAAIITSTPGTVWAGLSPDESELTIHVLDLKDREGLTRLIKTRFERPLMRIFE